MPEREAVVRIHQVNDNDLRKGACEGDNPREKSQNSMRGQLGHRDQDPMIKGYDTDFPEPGESPEHSGEKQEAVDEKKKKGEPVAV